MLTKTQKIAIGSQLMRAQVRVEENEPAFIEARIQKRDRLLAEARALGVPTAFVEYRMNAA